MTRPTTALELPTFPCPLCEEPDVVPLVGQGDYKDCKCPTCGTFRLTGSMLAWLREWGSGDRRLRAGLSAYIRQRNKVGETPVLTTTFNAREIAESYCHTVVHTKLRRVMERYEELTHAPGAWVELDTKHDYPLFDAASQEEVEYLIATLDEQGLLEFDDSKQRGYRITVPGWTFLEPVSGGIAGASFVAMAFGQELNAAYDEGIYPALKVDCGFDSIRLDRVEHTQNINDKILADIRRSQFLVADFTLHRNGVYFEAGFGLGLGKTVIWTCRQNDFKDRVHFDTRPYNHILWETPSELRAKLTDRVRAVIPNAKMS
jgi:hypothetical protein